MSTSKNNLQNTHFIIIPFLAPGHMIPMVDMSKLIAKHGVTVTIITTPINATRFKSTIDRAIKEGDNDLDIRLCQLDFPTTEASIPKGCENIDMLPSSNLYIDFHKEVSKLQDPIENFLTQIQPKPNCIVSDTVLPWTSEIAKMFEIPRIVFDAYGCLTVLCLHNLETTDFLKTISSKSETFVVPGLRDRILLSKEKLPKYMRTMCESYIVHQNMINVANESFGTVVNSFTEFESEYFEELKMVRGKNVWGVGPVSLCRINSNTDVVTYEKCQKWLDLQKSTSVIYACLGSICYVESSEIMELALGLEESKRPFILTLKEESDVERQMDEVGFIERVEGKGLIVKGWAPQTMILSHSSVGGFLTHCGWNSVLEGISASLPMVTCPINWEQFMNEEYLVNVLKVGVKIRNEVNKKGKEEGDEEIEVSRLKRDNVRRAIDLVMDGGIKGNEMRNQAKKLGLMAHQAMEKHGSSYNDIKLMIQRGIEYFENKMALK